MKKIVTKIGKTWQDKKCPMPESKSDGKQMLLLDDNFEDLLLGFANKGEVEVTIELVKNKEG